MNASGSSIPMPDLKPAPKRDRFGNFVERRLPMLIIYLMVLTLAAAIAAPHIVVTVPSGHVGLVWKRFRGGTLLDPRKLKDEGMRILWPWDRMFLYNLRMQSTTDTYKAITKDGVNLNATVAIRFRLKHDAVPQLHQAIGPNYVHLLIVPEIGSRMREVISQFTAEEVYSTKRQEIQERILGRSESMMAQKSIQRTAEQSEYGDHYDIPLDGMVNLVDTLVLGMELPPPVVAAINRKVEQFYLVQEYEYRVEREKKESERKKIEAEGISAFQRTVSQGISDSYVRWRGIEATLQLAQSNNAKIVVIGSGKDGLPIILGNVDAPVPSPAQTPGVGEIKASPRVSPPVEHKPASHLSPPPEEDKPATTAEPKDAAPSSAATTNGKQSAAQPEGSRFLPFTLSEIQTLLSRAISPASPAPPASPSEPRQ